MVYCQLSAPFSGTRRKPLQQWLYLDIDQWQWGCLVPVPLLFLSCHVPGSRRSVCAWGWGCTRAGLTRPCRCWPLLPAATAGTLTASRSATTPGSRPAAARSRASQTQCMSSAALAARTVLGAPSETAQFRLSRSELGCRRAEEIWSVSEEVFPSFLPYFFLKGGGTWPLVILLS